MLNFSIIYIPNQRSFNDFFQLGNNELNGPR